MLRGLEHGGWERVGSGERVTALELNSTWIYVFRRLLQGGVVAAEEVARGKLIFREFSGLRAEASREWSGFQGQLECSLLTLRGAWSS